MNLQSINEAIEYLSQRDKNFLINFGTDPVLRKFLSTERIKICNKLVKLGLMCKGTSDDKHKNVVYYVDTFIYNKL